MSFVDLATLTIHRQNELEARVNSFLDKSSQAINQIKRLETQAQSFVRCLNCQPSELKERFLSCMHQLEEYTYLITDFNLALAKLDNTQCMDFTPVLEQNCNSKPPPSSTPFNIIDILSESAPSKTTTCPHFCQTAELKKVKVPKKEQILIEFSSNSCSSESVPSNKCEDKEVQCEVATGIENININEGASTSSGNDPYNLPAQTILETDRLYPATIMSVDGTSFWVIIEYPEVVYKLMTDMTDYYRMNHVPMTVTEVTSLTYCAFLDDEGNSYYRAFFIKLVEDLVQVFLLDTGEMRSGPITSVQPLVPQFCESPPYARCCHLAGIDLTVGDESEDLTEKQEEFLRLYLGVQCHIEVDDNTSESMGVYVILPSCPESLNHLMVKEGLAVTIDKNVPTTGPPELVDSDIDNYITNCPEYEDPVEAVTGYHNRDEFDICKNYKGGQDKMCFKGSRCKKRHVVKHPDGWTLDKVEAFVCQTLPLPAPGTWHKVVVTYVCHYNRAYVQFVDENIEEPPVPSFGVVLPPTTLSALVRDMNSPASRLAYKPLTMIPALGEMVAALYPLDNNWYRARVVNFCRAEQNVEVMYVDYGNTVWVKENDIRALPPRWCALPAQAARVRLAGVAVPSSDSKLWALAKQRLHDLVYQRTLQLHVVGRDYDEITVELFDDDVNLANELAKLDIVVIEDYSIEDDTNVNRKQVLP
ncbi:maternal protein tudor [Amyelois transitella]|uniref:maternal protein tudor n=1 Tax=Amyelois transitella TaxID=680683 RepID=UPI00067C2115|nr:maternal protein tudor [Amyelois transitella]